MSKKTTVRDDLKITEKALEAFVAFSQEARETSQAGNSKEVNSPLAEVAQLQDNWDQTFRPFFRVRKTILAVLAAAKVDVDDLQSTKAVANALMKAHPEMLEAEMRAEQVIFSTLVTLIAPFSKKQLRPSTIAVAKVLEREERLIKALESKDTEEISAIQEEILSGK